MSILFSTPCYGAMVTAPHYKSCMELTYELTQSGVDHDWNIIWNESLVTRARNVLVKKFLETDFQKLMFLDSDIDFLSEDVAKLWNLNTSVCVGLYPMKKEGSPIGAWRDGKLVDLDRCPPRPFPVDYAGTGFMMIDREVFEKMKPHAPEHEHGWGFFQDPIEDFHLSEDYFFCRKWRELGGEIIADPSIKLGHWGLARYAA